MIRFKHYNSSIIITLYVFIIFNLVLAQPIVSPDCVISQQSSNAIYQICMPTQNWNGDLVIYAHGFVAPQEPLALPEEAALFGPMFNQQGFAFATTSYSVNGVTAAKSGVADIIDLVDIFLAEHGDPLHIYLIGVSLGGNIAIRCAEIYGDIFSGVLSLSGIVSDFKSQIKYVGNFRTVFNYFFPDVIPGETIDIPQHVIDNWETLYVPKILFALNSQPDALRQLLAVTKIPVDTDESTMVIEAIISLLWFNVMANNDMIERMGGNPYSNMRKFYRGSDNDWQLNRTITRYRTSRKIRKELNKYYINSGDLTIPTITMHGTGDYVVPIIQQFIYRMKVLFAGKTDKYIGIPVVRYGHVNFEIDEIIGAFSLLLQKVQAPLSEDQLNLNFKGTVKTSFMNPAKKRFCVKLLAE